MSEKQYAIVFPGQGSQSVGMLSDIGEHFAIVKDTFNTASSVLGYDLLDMVLNGPAESLNQTTHTQPALLTASYAVWQILKDKQRTQPTMLAGHSLGEYTALVCADALKFEDAVRLVAARGKFMQEAVAEGQGAMAAIIGLDDAKVKEICDASIVDGEVLAPANFNSVGQVVIAGSTQSVEAAMSQAKEAGARMVMPIPVSVPSHCALMQPAADKLATELETVSFNTPSIPVINNADVKQYQNESGIKDGLVKQLYMPVRWVETIQHMSSNGIEEIIECGPGKVLTGLNKRINKTLTLLSTGDLVNLSKVVETE